jgi:hypothetical protein
MKRILISAAVVLVTALSVVLIVSATNASETKKAKTEVVKGSCCDTAKAATACDKTASKQAGCDQTAAKQAGCDKTAANQAGCCDEKKCDPATCTKADCNHGAKACDGAKDASASAASASAEVKSCAVKCGGH